MCNMSHLFHSVSFSLSLSPVSLFLTDLPGHLVIDCPANNIRQERRATPPSLFPWNVVGRGFFTPHPFAQLLIPFQCRRLRAWGSLDREKLAYAHVITRVRLRACAIMFANACALHFTRSTFFTLESLNANANLSLEA